MLRNGLLNLQSAQRVSGTIMPIIRSSRLYRWLQHVVHNTLFKASRVVWCGAVGYASQLRDIARLSQNKVSCTTCYNYLYSLELLMMGIMVPETC